MDIRLCNKNDEDSWIALNRQFMLFEITDSSQWNDTDKTPDSVFRETFRDALKSPSLIKLLIFEEDGVPIGFANLAVFFSIWSHGKGILMDDIFFVESCRGKGYGKIAMEYIENFAKENDCKRLEFMSKPSNQLSRDFYIALGYKSVDMYFYVKHL